MPKPYRKPAPSPNAIWIDGATSSVPRTKLVGNIHYRRWTQGVVLPTGEVVRSDWWVPASEWPQG